MSETLRYQQEVKAKKEHKCSYCTGRIMPGENYLISTHKSDGEIYDWKAHKWCDRLVDLIKMEDDDGGITQDNFIESVSEFHFDLMHKMFTPEEIKRLPDVLSQLRYVNFRDKLSYVIRHFAKLEKETK